MSRLSQRDYSLPLLRLQLTNKVRNHDDLGVPSPQRDESAVRQQFTPNIGAGEKQIALRHGDVAAYGQARSPVTCPWASRNTMCE